MYTITYTMAILNPVSDETYDNTLSVSWMGETLTDSVEELTLTVENEIDYDLPSTGGSDRSWMYILLGLLLCGGAGGLLIRGKCRGVI
ncbi:MAG: LPXTG cell wall anchor domain-containing protein [Lachnospiraceae bacterium]|nr:LPXTG cell wall anchor domain-containing protein [Lachnospiraceae bacterium]